MAQNRTSGVWLERKTKMKEFKGIWMPNEVVKDEKLSDKGKIVYSIILALSKNNDCIISNSYISELLNITKTQVSRIINTLKKAGYIDIELIHKENSKEIAMRKCIPVNKYVNTYKQNSSHHSHISGNNTYRRYYRYFSWNSLCPHFLTHFNTVTVL